MASDPWNESPEEEYRDILDTIIKSVESIANSVRRVSEKQSKHDFMQRLNNAEGVLLDQVRKHNWIPKARKVQSTLESISSTVDQWESEWGAFEEAKKADERVKHASRKRKTYADQERPQAKRAVSSSYESSGM
jgi:uncharacterized protein YukE